MAASELPDAGRAGTEARPGPEGGAAGEGGVGLPAPSPTAWKLRAPPKDAEQALQRRVRASLNKVCPENVRQIAGQIAEINLASTKELEVVIGLIMEKALSEPHYCETYADLVHMLHGAVQAFPNPEGGKPVTVRSTTLTACQVEFESMRRSARELSPEVAAASGPEGVEFQRLQKQRMRANMKFIGNLFLRQLLEPKTIISIVLNLIDAVGGEAVPAEHIVECACELIMAVGLTLESLPGGRAALTQSIGRLQDLKQRIDNEGQALYCKRVKFTVQDLLDARAAGWTKKSFKATPQTKDEIRRDEHDAGHEVHRVPLPPAQAAHDGEHGLPMPGPAGRQANRPSARDRRRRQRALELAASAAP